MIVARTKADQNLAVVDPWTLVHAGAGLAVGLMGFSLGAALLGAVVYELLEGPFERADFGRNLFNVSRPESPANQVADVAVFMAAAAAGRRWNKITPGARTEGRTSRVETDLDWFETVG